MEGKYTPRMSPIKEERKKSKATKAKKEDPVVKQDEVLARNLEIEQANMKIKVNNRVQEESMEEEKILLGNEFVKSLIHPYKKVLEYLIKKGFIKERTPFCKHKIRSCYLNCLEGFFKNFYYAFVVKAVLAVGLGMLRPSKNLIPNLLDLLSKDCLSFCTFLGAFGGGYKFLL